MSNYGIEVKLRNEVLMMSCDDRFIYYQSLENKWSRFRPFDETSVSRRLKMLEAIAVRKRESLQECEDEREKQAIENLRSTRSLKMSVILGQSLREMNSVISACLIRISVMSQKKEEDIIQKFENSFLEADESSPLLITDGNDNTKFDIDVIFDYESKNELSFLDSFKGKFDEDQLQYLVFPSSSYASLNSKMKTGHVYVKGNEGDIQLSDAFYLNSKYYVFFLNKSKVWLRLYDAKGKDHTSDSLVLEGYVRSEFGSYISFSFKDFYSLIYPLYVLAVDGNDRTIVDCCVYDQDKIKNEKSIGSFKSSPLVFRKLGYFEGCQDFYGYFRLGVYREVFNLLKLRTYLFPVNIAIDHDNVKNNDSRENYLLHVDFKMIVKSFNLKCLGSLVLYLVVLFNDTFVRVTDKVCYSGLSSFSCSFKAELTSYIKRQYALAFCSDFGINDMLYSLSSYWMGVSSV